MPTPSSNPAPVQRKPGLILGMIGLVLRLLGLMLVSLLCSIVLEMLGLLLIWPEQGWHHAESMLVTELGWLSTYFKHSLLIAEPAQTTATLVGYLSHWLLVETGWAAVREHLPDLSHEDGLQGLLAQLYLVSEDYLLAALFTTATFIVRLTVLGLATPLFLLAGLTGSVDGLMRRDLRRFGAGRESSFVYHRARRLILPLLLSPWLIYLSMPWSINPLIILLPCAGMLGFTVAIATATFKKYL
ncbi:TIGR03747 family integrating conjugative element membrane protein [Pseudomonas putida]